MPATGPPLLGVQNAEHEPDRETNWSEVARSSPSAAGTPGLVTAAGAAVDQRQVAGSPAPEVLTVPVWLHRLRGDGLPTTSAGSATPRALDSQRFVKRWKGVAGGY